MFSKKFFNARSGALQLNFDLNDARIYLTIADPIKGNDTTKKFDWQNGLNFTISEDLSEEFLAGIKNVLSGKQTNANAIVYNTPTIQKAIAFGQKSNGTYAIVVKHGNKHQKAYEFNDAGEVKRFYNIINSFFSNAFLANLIIDGIITRVQSVKQGTTQQSNNRYKGSNTKYTKQQSNQFDDTFDNNDTIDEDFVTDKANQVIGGLDLENMF